MEKGHTIVMCLTKRENRKKKRKTTTATTATTAMKENRMKRNEPTRIRVEKGEPNENAPGAKAFKRIE